MPAAPTTQSYTSGCHCGRTILHVTLPPLDDEDHAITSCNCTICTKHGLAVQYCRRRDIHFEKGEKDLKSYFCGSRTRVMRFCGECGVVLLFDAQCGGEEKERDTVVAINVCAIEGYDPDEVVFKSFDGRSVPIAQN